MSSRRIHRESEFSRGKKIIGAETAAMKLRALGEDVLIAAEIELAIGADNIVQEAKRRCSVKTGKLRDSIKATEVADGAAYDFSANARNESGIAYGQFVEFSPKINRPFLYPAIRANVKFIKQNIKLAVQEALRNRYGHSAA